MGKTDQEFITCFVITIQQSITLFYNSLTELWFKRLAATE